MKQKLSLEEEDRIIHEMADHRLMSISVSVVVPAFNSQESLPHLVDRLRPVLELISKNYELILVNDGSSDGTWATILGLARKNCWITGLNLMKNYGQHNALLCGIRAAKHDVIVTMDDDLQHPPEQIPVLLGKLKEGFDVVYGTTENMQHNFFRTTSSKATKWFMKTALGAEPATNISSFRAFRAKLREAFSRYDGPFVSIDALLTWGTTRFAAQEFKHASREFGVSQYTLRRLVEHALNMITGFSVLPLRLASIVGFLFTVFGLCMLGLVILKYLFEGSTVPGFSFLASIISIYSGVQLFALGLTGEYLARLYLRSMNKPAYVVFEHTDTQADSVNEPSPEHES